jgi:hypothetical protein
MDAEKDAGKYLFEAYFHQDALVDDPTWEAVIDRFKDAEKPETVAAVRASLREALDSFGDDELARFLQGKCFFVPSSVGLTPRRWLQAIVHLLAGGSDSPTRDFKRISNARRQAGIIANDVLSGVRSYVAGLGALADIEKDLDLPGDDRDIGDLALADGGLDEFPDSTSREAWARDTAGPAFKSLASRFGSAA